MNQKCLINFCKKLKEFCASLNYFQNEFKNVPYSFIKSILNWTYGENKMNINVCECQRFLNWKSKFPSPLMISDLF